MWSVGGGRGGGSRGVGAPMVWAGRVEKGGGSKGGRPQGWGPFWLKPFWLKPFLAQGDHCFCVDRQCSVFLLYFCKTSHFHGSQGIEVPSGWLQVIRGPKPPAVRWPPANKVPVVRSSPANVPGRSRVRVQVHPQQNVVASPTRSAQQHRHE